MGAMVSQITSLSSVYSTVYSGADQKNSPGTGEFLAQMASNAENVSIWWRHHVLAHIQRRGIDNAIYDKQDTAHMHLQI